LAKAGKAIIGVKLNAETKALELKDCYEPSNAYWLRTRDLDMNVTGPIFDYKGKEIWNSRKTIIASFGGGLSAGAGVVYVSATDSTLHAFGFPIESRKGDSHVCDLPERGMSPSREVTNVTVPLLAKPVSFQPFRV
jgi:hypothetical protein